MANPHQGSCLCGRVKFLVDGDFDGFFLCHCKHCQKDTGSAHASNLFSSKAQLRWLSGQENIQTFRLMPTRHVKSFCKECGSAVPTLQMEGQLVVVPAGSLDTEVATKPTAHIFWSSKANWEADFESLQKFEKFPST